MDRTLVTSNAIASVGYDAAAARLEIEFTTGRVYEYDDVPRATYDWLMRVTNKGTFVTRVLSPRHRYREVKVNTPQLDLAGLLGASLERLRSGGPG